MPKRTKPNTMVIADQVQAADAMKQLKEISREIDSVNLEMDERIDLAKQTAKQLLTPLKAKSKELEHALANFGHHHKTELFKKKRSMTTPFGVFGFRKSTVLKTLPRFTLAHVLEKLDSFGFREAVTVKKSVNKEAMRDWPDERLESVGMRRVIEDKFYIELNKEEINDPA